MLTLCTQRQSTAITSVYHINIEPTAAAGSDVLPEPRAKPIPTTPSSGSAAIKQLHQPAAFPKSHKRNAAAANTATAAATAGVPTSTSTISSPSERSSGSATAQQLRPSTAPPRPH